MHAAAESLRYILITLQVLLLVHMIQSGLWRRVPFWCAWLACEVFSRALFSPGGNYWHQVWLHLQPVSLLLLAGAAIEARWHAGQRADVFAVAALVVAPVGVGLNLQEVAAFRLAVNFGVLVMLLPCPAGNFTTRWHARILAGLCLAAGLTGWRPATDDAWWAMRVVFLGVYCVACLGWTVVFYREE